MADAGVIRELFISLGYKTDDSARQRFTANVKEAGQQTDAFQKTLNEAATALNAVSAAFNTASGEPHRKYMEQSQRLLVRQKEVNQGFKDFGIFIISTATAFAAGVTEVAKRYEQLYYIVQRTGTQAGTIAGAGFGATQIGLQADTMTQMVNYLRTMTTLYPGYLDILKSMAGGIDIAPLLDRTKSIVEQRKAFQQLIENISKLSGPMQGQIAGMLGTTVEALQRLFANMPEFEKGTEDFDAMLKRIGGSQEEYGRQTVEFTRKFNTLWMNLFGDPQFGAGGIRQQIEREAMPLIGGFIDRLDQLIEKVQDFNTLHPGAALTEGIAAAAASYLGLASAIGAVTGNWGLLAAGLRGGAIGIALFEIYQHWDDITNLLKQTPEQWRKIGEDAGNALVDAILGVTSEEGGTVFQPLVDAANGVVPQMVEAGKKAVDGFMTGLREELSSTGAGKAFVDFPKWLRDLLATPIPGTGLPAQPGEPSAGAPLPPHLQTGGIVRADLHHGEAVLPAELTQRLMRAGTNEQDQGILWTLERIWEGLQNWWLGSGSYRPFVIARDDPTQSAQGNGGIPGYEPGTGRAHGVFGVGAPRRDPGGDVAPRPGGATVIGPMSEIPAGSTTVGDEFFNYGNIRVPGAGPGGPLTNPAGWRHFASMAEGLQAVAHLLSSYASKGYNTLSQMISRWAPSNENNTSLLISRAAKWMGVDPNTPLDLSNPQTMARAVAATIANEHGWSLPRGLGGFAGIERMLGGGQAMGMSAAPGGGRHVAVNQTNNVTIHTSEAAAGHRLALVHQRLSGDTLRSMKTALS